jgi:hypothetical protein
MQNCEQAGPNTENIVQLAAAGVNLPEIYAGNPPGVHTIDVKLGESKAKRRKCCEICKLA